MMPPPPNCAWGWPCHTPSVGWAPPPREEEAVVWDPLPDLEAIPGATDERVMDCTAINFLRGVLVTLWVCMIYAMVQYARSHYHQEGWEIIVMLEFVIAIGVTPYFGIAAEALDDVESMM